MSIYYVSRFPKIFYLFFFLVIFFDSYEQLTYLPSILHSIIYGCSQKFYFLFKKIDSTNSVKREKLERIFPCDFHVFKTGFWFIEQKFMKKSWSWIQIWNFSIFKIQLKKNSINSISNFEKFSLSCFMQVLELILFFLTRILMEI